MKRLFLVLFLTIALGLSGCAGENAKELFDTASLEERQNAPEHAAELYREIVEKYPDSEYATKAKERLADLKENK